MRARRRKVTVGLLVALATAAACDPGTADDVDWEARALARPGVLALAEVQPGDDTTGPAVDTTPIARAPKPRTPCEADSGMVERLEGDPATIVVAQLRNYVLRRCFGNAPATDTDSAEAEEGPHPTLDRLLLFMPEKRMLSFHPDSLAPGQGAVVAAVENYDRDSLQSRTWGSGRLRAGQEGFLWYGKDASDSLYVVFFKFVRNATGPLRYSEIARGAWEHQPDTTLGLRARWNHPVPVTGGPATGHASPAAPPSPFVRAAFAPGTPALPTVPLLGAALQSAGGGWISCLRGCCKTSNVFVR